MQEVLEAERRASREAVRQDLEDELDLDEYNKRLPSGTSRSGKKQERSKGVSTMVQPCLGRDV